MADITLSVKATDINDVVNKATKLKKIYQILQPMRRKK